MPVVSGRVQEQDGRLSRAQQQSGPGTDVFRIHPLRQVGIGFECRPVIVLKIEGLRAGADPCTVVFVARQGILPV